MYALFDLIFRNIFLILLALLIYIVFKEYKDLKEREEEITKKFEEVLNPYLIKKIEESKSIVEHIKNLYDTEEIQLELQKIETTINKGIQGSINDKVETSNTINKYKLGNHLDLEKYPALIELNKIGTFTEEDMESLDNGVAITRREYNALAFSYNEKASGILLQYLTKLLRLTQNYVIFDAPKSKAYEEKYEVFEEKEPEINTISTLNRKDRKEVVVEQKEIVEPEEKKEVKIEHSDIILKPSESINSLSEKSNK